MPQPLTGTRIVYPPLPAAHFGAGTIGALHAIVRSTGGQAVALVGECNAAALPRFTVWVRTCTPRSVASDCRMEAVASVDPSFTMISGRPVARTPTDSPSRRRSMNPRTSAELASTHCTSSRPIRSGPS